MGGQISIVIMEVIACLTTGYLAFHMSRDYRKKNITPIKNLRPLKVVSIEGQVRCLNKDVSHMERVYEKNINYTMSKDYSKVTKPNQSRGMTTTHEFIVLGILEKYSYYSSKTINSHNRVLKDLKDHGWQEKEKSEKE